MARTPLALSYDQAEQNLVYVSNTTWYDLSTIPEMNRNDHYELTLQVYNDAPTKANLASINTTSFVLNIGLNGTAPVVSSNAASFSYTNAASGEITCNVNTHSANLTSSILTNASKNYYCVVEGTEDAIGSSQILARFPLKIINIVGTGS